MKATISEKDFNAIATELKKRDQNSKFSVIAQKFASMLSKLEGKPHKWIATIKDRLEKDARERGQRNYTLDLDPRHASSVYEGSLYENFKIIPTSSPSNSTASERAPNQQRPSRARVGASQPAAALPSVASSSIAPATTGYQRPKTPEPSRIGRGGRPVYTTDLPDGTELELGRVARRVVLEVANAPNGKLLVSELSQKLRETPSKLAYIADTSLEKTAKSELRIKRTPSNNHLRLG